MIIIRHANVAQFSRLVSSPNAQFPIMDHCLLLTNALLDMLLPLGKEKGSAFTFNIQTTKSIVELGRDSHEKQQHD